MKKLIISMASVVCAMGVHAASVAWNMNSVASSPDTTLSAAGQYTAFFFATGDTSGQLRITTLVDVLAKITTGGDITSLVSFTTANKYAAGKATFTSTGNGAFDAGIVVSGFAIILDSLDLATAKNYMIAQTARGDQILTKTAGTSGAMTFSYGSQANNTWQPVPEPTSGLMILLGMAGLALRRKGA